MSVQRQDESWILNHVTTTTDWSNPNIVRHVHVSMNLNLHATKVEDNVLGNHGFVMVTKIVKMERMKKLIDVIQSALIMPLIIGQVQLT